MADLVHEGLTRHINVIARNHNATPVQISLAWLLAQGDDIVPIPGTKQRGKLLDISTRLRSHSPTRNSSHSITCTLMADATQECPTDNPYSAEVFSPARDSMKRKRIGRYSAYRCCGSSLAVISSRVASSIAITRTVADPSLTSSRIFPCSSIRPKIFNTKGTRMQLSNSRQSAVSNTPAACCRSAR